MQSSNEFLKNVNYQPVFSIGRAAVLLGICIIVTVLLMHTLHVMGQGSSLYRKRKPVEGWTKRVFMAGVFLIAILLVIFWLLGRWSHALQGTV